MWKLEWGPQSLSTGRARTRPSRRRANRRNCYRERHAGLFPPLGPVGKLFGEKLANRQCRRRKAPRNPAPHHRRVLNGVSGAKGCPKLNGPIRPGEAGARVPYTLHNRRCFGRQPFSHPPPICLRMAQAPAALDFDFAPPEKSTECCPHRSIPSIASHPGPPPARCRQHATSHPGIYPVG